MKISVAVILTWFSTAFSPGCIWFDPNHFHFLLSLYHYFKQKESYTLLETNWDQVCSMLPESLFQVCLEEWSVCWQQSLCANKQGALGKHLDTWGKTNVLQHGTRYSPGAGSSCLVALIVDVLGGHNSNSKMVKKVAFICLKTWKEARMIHLIKIHFPLQGCLCVWCSTHWALHCINHISHCRCDQRQKVHW